MTVQQIYQLLNDTATQVMGSQAVATLDLQDMVSLRDTVYGTGADAFLNVLVDRIGKTVLRTLDFTATFPKLLRTEFEFGAVLQKVNINPMMAQAQEAWNVGSGAFTPNLYKIDKASIAQTFFKDAQTYELDITIPDTLFKTAFTSAEAMASFITGIFDTMSTSLNMHIENQTRIAILGLLGEKINAGNGVVDLVALYNDVATTPISTASEAMESKDFLRFAGKVMRNYIKYMAKPSVLYNTAGMVRATARDNMHVMVLTEFASACSTYLESETFHNELVSLPYYTEVEYWQGTGATAPNFADCSSIDVEIPSDGTKITQSGIVAVFADREAIGVGLYDRFSAVDRNNRNRYTNYTEGITSQWFVDDSENAVIFTVIDAHTP